MDIQGLGIAQSNLYALRTSIFQTRKGQKH